MKYAEIVSAVCALAAAGFWFRSARIVLVPGLTRPSGEGAVTDVIRRQSRLSAVAAIFAATSAFVDAVVHYIELAI